MTCDVSLFLAYCWCLQSIFGIKQVKTTYFYAYKVGLFRMVYKSAIVASTFPVVVGSFADLSHLYAELAQCASSWWLLGNTCNYPTGQDRTEQDRAGLDGMGWDEMGWDGMIYTQTSNAAQYDILQYDTMLHLAT